ncbi:MAG: 2-hydroxyacyl-CoA dehydratase [Desulfomonile tiedjei]|nr:2-hydroxyacyl-CoA dehydratase [Desulfomonile tiedjei]
MKIGSFLAYHLKAGVIGKAALRFERLRSKWKAGRKGTAGNDSLVPPLASRFRMKELISQQYLAGNYANGVKKVAWVASGAPVEILQALDYFVYFPDNHSALCGARRQAVEFATEAENAGYSRDICSYPRTEIGAFLTGRSPVGRIPKPDLIVCSNNICQTILQWYQVMAAYHKAQFVNIDTPFLYEGPKDHQIEYVQKQLEDLISIAERIAGKSLKYARLKEALRLGKEASELWLAILNRAQTKPSPLTAFDAFINMGPIVALRGQPETISFYRNMLKEVDERISKGVGAVKNEKARLLWDNLPIWYRLSWLSQLLAERGVNVVISNYTYGWGELAPLMDPLRPIESMARVYLMPYLNRSVQYKLQSMKNMVKDFDLDGVILHSDRSCKPYSIGQIDQRNELVNGLGIPAMLLEADHNDSRVFSEQQTKNRLEAFVEMLC